MARRFFLIGLGIITIAGAVGFSIWFFQQRELEYRAYTDCMDRNAAVKTGSVQAGQSLYERLRDARLNKSTNLYEDCSKLKPAWMK